MTGNKKAIKEFCTESIVATIARVIDANKGLWKFIS
jgi:hypothetical protein